MKIISLPKSPSSAGYALMMTLIFLTIALMGFASIMHWASSSTVVTERNNLYVAAQAASESASEKVITTMMRDFAYGGLNPVSSYSSIMPNTDGWPVQFTFSATNGVANQASVNIGQGAWTQLPSEYHGLYGYGRDCLIAVTATTVGQRNNVSSTVSQWVWFGNIPLFQYAIFYNMDMELNPGGTFDINGRVHSNFNIYATGSSSSSPLNFSDSVDSSGIVTNRSSNLDPRSPARTGYVVYADTNSPVQNADTLNMPIGNDAENYTMDANAILDLPPDGMGAPLPAAYSTNGQVYLYNEADLVISNSAAGINGYSTTNALKVYYQNPNQVVPLVTVSPDVKSVQTVASNSYTVGTTYDTNVTSHTTTSGKGKNKVTTTTYTTNVVANTTTNIVTVYYSTTNYIYYSWVTNVTYYDYREGKTVQAVQVDVASLNAWLADNSANGGQQYQQYNTIGSTSKGHDINSIYVYSDVGMNNSTLPAVRVTDGEQLPPSGLTVATPLPLYVKGDYNVTTNGVKYSRALGDTTNTTPAALLGDAITVLSSSWSDSYNSSTSVSSRNPVSTTVNAATLEGIVPSDGTHYSGGVENFLRLLENWSGRTLTYNGSIVVMFSSQYATKPWDGSYYTVPTRKWGFDVNFLNQDRLPPLTPQIKTTFRGNYVTR